MGARGDITFDADGKRFTACFGFGAMAAIEEKFDLPFMQVVQRAFPQGEKATAEERGAQVRFSDIATFFEAMLQKHHDLTMAEIHDLIDDLGLQKVVDLIGRALASGIGSEDRGGSTANPPRPRQKRSTG
jgi:ATP:corrinoid adenosyltransferase